jgi:hypothetical protein
MVGEAISVCYWCVNVNSQVQRRKEADITALTKELSSTKGSLDQIKDEFSKTSAALRVSGRGSFRVCMKATGIGSMQSLEAGMNSMGLRVPSE